MWRNECRESLFLHPGTVHLWHAKLVDAENQSDRLDHILSADEKARGDRFIKREDRIYYKLSRVILRQVLARYLNCLPEKIEFHLGDHGKPSVVGGGLEFNLSHSGDYLLIGVTAENPIGVDVEHVRKNQDFLALAKRFFAESEYKAIINQSAEKQRAAFYHCWTRKEAFIKAIGLGLSFPLSDFEVDVSETLDDRSRLLQVHQKFSAADWILRSISLEDAELSYFAAFAVRGNVERIFYWNFSSDMC